MEQTSIKRIAQLHPKLRDEVLAVYNEAVKATPAGVHPFIDQTLRSFEESDALYKKGRDANGKVIDKNAVVTNAPGGASYHNYGLALDFHLQVDGKDIWPKDVTKDKNWMLVVSIFKKHGFSWGGDFTSPYDPPHFEKTFGHNWRDLLALHKAGKVDKDGYVII